MTQQVYSVVWHIICVVIIFTGPSCGFGIFGIQATTPSVPEPEVTTSEATLGAATTTSTPAPFLQPPTTTHQGSLSDHRLANGTIRLPSHILAALQLLKTYVSQKTSGTSPNNHTATSGTPNPTASSASLFNTQNTADGGQNVNTKDTKGPLSNSPSTTGSGTNALQKNTSSASLFDILNKQGSGSTSTIANSMDVPLNSPLPFGNEMPSNVPLFNSATGSFVGTGPQIDAIGPQKTPTKSVTFFDLLSQMGEQAQETQLADIFNTLNVLQNGGANSLTAAMLADIDLPEKSGNNQAKVKPVQQLNTHDPNSPPCTHANSGSSASSKSQASSGSSAQMQPQTGLLLPVDQPTNTGQVQNLPVRSNPSLAMPRPGSGNVDFSQSQGYNPYQVPGNPNEVGMSTSVSNTQQILQTNPRQMLGTPAQMQGNIPLYPQGVGSVQVDGLRSSGAQNWNTPPSQIRSSSLDNPNVYMNQQRFAMNQQQPLNVQQTEPLPNLGNSVHQQPGRQTSSLMAGPTPDPSLSVFQPVFGRSPPQPSQVQPGQAHAGQPGSAVPPETASATGQNPRGSVSNTNQGSNTQLSKVMSGQTSDIATYYQTVDGKLIRVIPYHKAATTSQVPQPIQFPVQGARNLPASQNGNVRQGNPNPNVSQVNQTSASKRETAQTQYTRLSMRNQRLNPYTVQRRQLRQLPSIRYAQQRPVYQRRVPVYRRTGYPRQTQSRYPSTQQMRVPTSANILAQNQLSQFQFQNAQNFPQQANYLTVAARASMQPKVEETNGQNQMNRNSVQSQGVFANNGEVKSRSTASNGQVMQMASINKLIESPTAQQQIMSNQIQHGGINSERFMIPSGASIPFPPRDNNAQMVKSR